MLCSEMAPLQCAVCTQEARGSVLTVLWKTLLSTQRLQLAVYGWITDTLERAGTLTKLQQRDARFDMSRERPQNRKHLFGPTQKENVIIYFLFVTEMVWITVPPAVDKCCCISPNWTDEKADIFIIIMYKWQSCCPCHSWCVCVCECVCLHQAL